MCGRLAYDQPEMVTGAGTLALALEIDAQAADAGCPDRMLHSARINGHDPYAYFKDDPFLTWPFYDRSRRGLHD